jgi:membrane protease YdiL (CAAX protease family)
LKNHRTTWGLASYVCILAAFRLGLARWAITNGLGKSLPYAFASFALLLAPLWFFGFGAGEWLRERIRSRWLRIALPAVLGAPYLVFAFPAGVLHSWLAAAVCLLPLALASFLEFSDLPSKLTWQDAVVLGVLAATSVLRLLQGAWPYTGLGALPKLFVADLALYLYVVVRKLEGIGYSFVPTPAAILIGLREWAYFLPFGIGLGAALKFTHFHPRLPSAISVATGVLVTFFLVAIPEEMFFRGILQNLLEARFGRTHALITSAILFGLAHFNKGASFNWRYVLLAAIAGIFYGRAWRARRQLLASVITHTAVDVVWSLWFR